MDSIKLNGFSLEILTNSGTVHKTSIGNSNYFALPNKSEYRLRLRNNRNTRADILIWIDNEKIGKWRIEAFSKITIERPANSPRKLVFIKEGSREALNSGIRSGDSYNGLIKIEFRPEKIDYIPFNDNDHFYKLKKFCWNDNSISEPQYLSNLSNSSNLGNLCGMMNSSIQYGMMDTNCTQQSTSNYSSGATVLGDNSNQRFRKTDSIDNVDSSNITTIYARLIIDNNKSKKYISLKELNNLSTDIPPYLDQNEDFFFHKYSTDYF